MWPKKIKIHPTLGKGKSSTEKGLGKKDMLVSRRIDCKNPCFNNIGIASHVKKVGHVFWYLSNPNFGPIGSWTIFPALHWSTWRTDWFACEDIIQEVRLIELYENKEHGQNLNCRVSPVNSEQPWLVRRQRSWILCVRQCFERYWKGWELGIGTLEISKIYLHGQAGLMANGKGKDRSSESYISAEGSQI